MAARREPTDTELRAKYLRDTENARLRMRALRARQKAASRNASRVRVTNTPLHARDDVRSTAPVTTIKATTPPPSPPARTPSKSGELIDRLRAAGVAHDLNPKDHAALKRSALSAAQVAEVYLAIANHEFGDRWLCTRLSVVRAIEAWPGYANQKTRGPGPAAPERKSTGTRILEHLGYVAE